MRNISKEVIFVSVILFSFSCRIHKLNKDMPLQLTFNYELKFMLMDSSKFSDCKKFKNLLLKHQIDDAEKMMRNVIKCGDDYKTSEYFKFLKNVPHTVTYENRLELAPLTVKTCMSTLEYYPKMRIADDERYDMISYWLIERFLLMTADVINSDFWYFRPWYVFPIEYYDFTILPVKNRNLWTNIQYLIDSKDDPEEYDSPEIYVISKEGIQLIIANLIANKANLPSKYAYDTFIDLLKKAQDGTNCLVFEYGT